MNLNMDINSLLTAIFDNLSPMRWLCLLAATIAPAFAQLAPPNDSGISMGHVHLIVADPDVQKKIWVDILGAQVTSTGTLELLKIPGIFVIVGKARTPLENGSDGSTVNHFGFLVKSYAGVKAKLQAANISFTVDRPETKQLTAAFPDKVLVELTEDASLKTPIAFHHIHIATTDPETLRAWYVKTFGGNAGKRGDFLAAKFPGGEVDFRKATEAPAPTKGRTLDHIGFEVKNLDAFCKKLAADGIPFDGAYRDVPAIALKIAFILDPAGTRIELTEGLAAH
jgi:catechol 2,3-dioxygenase-like lactoylglutathione lyase family enzyme